MSQTISRASSSVSDSELEDPSVSRRPRSSSRRLWWRRHQSPTRELHDRPLLLRLWGWRCDDEEDLLCLLLLLRLRLQPRKEPEEGESESEEASRDLFLSRPCRWRRRLLSLSPSSLPISFRCVCVFIQSRSRGDCWGGREWATGVRRPTMQSFVGP
jgi:hypothetical protein